jgi:hypothetical protein
VDALRTKPVPLTPTEEQAMAVAAELVAAALEAQQGPAAEPVERPAVTVRRVIDLREARQRARETGTGGPSEQGPST